MYFCPQKAMVMKKIIFLSVTLLLAMGLQAQKLRADEHGSGMKRVNNSKYNPDPAPVVSYLFPYA